MAKKTTRKQARQTGMTSTATSSIAALHCRFVHGNDLEACDEIVRRCRDMVLATARRVLGDSHDAEDVCQETFTTYLEKAAALRHPEALPGWLAKTATHLALAAASRRKRHQGLEVLEFTPSKVAPPYHAIEHAEILAALRQEQSRLPESQRELLADILQGGLTWRETAEKRGTTQGPIQQARETLLARLSRRLCDVVGALLAALWLKGNAAASTPPKLAQEAAGPTSSSSATTLVPAPKCGKSIFMASRQGFRFVWVKLKGVVVVFIAILILSLTGHGGLASSKAAGGFSHLRFKGLDGMPIRAVAVPLNQIDAACLAKPYEWQRELVLGWRNVTAVIKDSKGTTIAPCNFFRISNQWYEVADGMEPPPILFRRVYLRQVVEGGRLKHVELAYGELADALHIAKGGNSAVGNRTMPTDCGR